MARTMRMEYGEDFEETVGLGECREEEVAIRKDI
jgi:hypothetical protein